MNSYALKEGCEIQRHAQGTIDSWQEYCFLSVVLSVLVVVFATEMCWNLACLNKHSLSL
jgi:hypothetical protein